MLLLPQLSCRYKCSQQQRIRVMYLLHEVVRSRIRATPLPPSPRILRLSCVSTCYSPEESGIPFLSTCRLRSCLQRPNPRGICSAPLLFFGSERISPSLGGCRHYRTNPSFAINKRLVELGKQQQWEALLDFAEQERRDLNNVNYATLMSQLGRMCSSSLHKSDPRFLSILHTLATRMEDRGLPWVGARSAANIIHAIGRMRLKNPSTRRILEWLSKPETAARFVEEGEPQAVANVAWACATLGFQAPHFFVEIERRSKWLVTGGTPQEVANTAWACATLGFVDSPNLFSEIEKRSKWLVEEGTPQAVANTALACAKLGFQAPNLFAEIERRSRWLVSIGKPQEVANTVWACASLGFQAPSLFNGIERRSKWLVEAGNPQEVANMAWACAKAGFQAAKLFAEIEHQSKWLVREGKSQEVANTAWSCATLGIQAPNLFAEIEVRSKWLVETGNPQEIANMAWACATLGCDAPRLFAEIERQAKRLVEEGTPQAVSITAWSCATFGYRAVELFVEIDRRSKRLVEEGNPQSIANSAWACATLGIEAPNLFAEVDRHLDRLLEQGNLQVICNTCHAIALLGLHKESGKSLAKLWDRAIELFINGEYLSHEEILQLAQTRMFAKAGGVLLTQPPATMSTRMELALNRIADNTRSRATVRISDLLQEIGFPHELEVSPNGTMSGGMLAIDFACTEQKIAIEYDGHSHYLKAVGNGQLTSTENGATKAKRRFLEQLGWTVINIDYRDYMQAQRALNEKEWLWAKLRASGV